MKLLTPNDIPSEVWTLLQSIGLPKYVTKAVITIEYNKLITIDCTFEAATKDNKLLVVDNKLITEVARYRLVKEEL